MSSIRLLPVILAASALVACSGGAKDAEKARADGKPARAADARPDVRLSWDIDAGREIYNRYCHYCHGYKGLGDGPVGIALSPHPADFVHDDKRMNQTDEELFKSITEGVHKEVGGEAMYMPRWQEILSDKERWDVLAYIRHLSVEGKKAEKNAGRK